MEGSLGGALARLKVPRCTLEDDVGWSCVANTAPVCMLATQEARRLWMRTLNTEWQRVWLLRSMRRRRGGLPALVKHSLHSMLRAFQPSAPPHLQLRCRVMLSRSSTSWPVSSLAFVARRSAVQTKVGQKLLVKLGC